MKRPMLTLQRVQLLSEFRPRGGFSYDAPVLHDGDAVGGPSTSKLVLFEDGVPLRRARESHEAVAGTGRGAYGHWGRHVVFSASDNTDPNTNGRSYSFAIDHAGQHRPEDDGRTPLNGPFQHRSGLCWTARISDEGEGTRSRLRLFEDDFQLGPEHAPPGEIEERGAGRYAHGTGSLQFSTSDGSDPNTNGRLYTYDRDD